IISRYTTIPSRRSSDLEVLDEAYQTFSLYEKITYLIKDQIIDGKKIQKSFETVRMIGNKAAHHNETNEFADAFKVHKEIYNIARSEEHTSELQSRENLV